MAMKATTSRHVYFEESIGTVTAFLQAIGGDIWQTYADPTNWVDNTNYTPQISRSKPRQIELFLSATATDDLRVAEANWTCNNMDCANNSGFFETSIINNRRAVLTLIDNIGKLTHNQGAVIKCTARIGSPDSMGTTKVVEQLGIPITQQTKDTYRCTIMALNGANNYTIGASGEPVSLQCLTYDWQGNLVTDSGLHYAWSKYKTINGAPGWEPLGQDRDTLDVGPDDVDNQAQIRVDVSLGGKVICNDFQTVYDNHDPVQIIPRFDPEDCTIRKNDPSHQAINVYISIERSDGTSATGANLTFMLVDTAGNEVQELEGRKWANVKWTSASQPGTGEVNSNGIAFTILPDDFRNGGKQLLLIIEGDVE